MEILKVFKNSITKYIFNNNEWEYHIDVEIDEKIEGECCFVAINYQDRKDPTFLLLSDSYEYDYGFTIKGGKPTPLGVRWIA